jgi:hypothetical protein
MVPFDQIFYWNSGVNFADPGDPNDVVIGSFQGNSMGSLSSSDPEAATYTNLGIAGYGLTAAELADPAEDDEQHANKWNAIQYKFNGFHKGSPLTTSLGNKAFNGIKIRLKFKISSSVTSNNEWDLRDIQMMHITIKQNDTVLKPSVDHNSLYAGKGSADPNYTWGFVKVTPDSASNYVTVNGGWHDFIDDSLAPSDIPNTSSNWNSNPRKFTFANDYTEAPLFLGTDKHDGSLSSFLPFFESISETSLNAFPQHPQGIRPIASDEYTWFNSHPTAKAIGTLALSKEVNGFTDYPLTGNSFNYPDHLYTTARYLLTNDDEPTGNSGSFTIWESNKVIPPGAEFKVTFARDITSASRAIHAGTQYLRTALPYDCRLELIPKN